jgi:GH15 family glucan-1,4-alpha-glucosidase
MNRNYLFTALYAWGRTIDTEQLVGVTSRSPRYYVSAAYWDRDAMLWSFPALLDIDRALAREALEYALGLQLRNAGTHSRFIDGVVLEDGFQLDEAAAPVLALGQYLAATGDAAFVAAHRGALDVLEGRLVGRFDAASGLYSSLQDPQDEYQRAPFITGDNVLVWRAFGYLASLHEALHEKPAAAAMRGRAGALRGAILARMVNPSAPGAGGPVFASATDGAATGATWVQTEMPPGSLMRLPALGFIDEQDPLFQRTYDWLHSASYEYSYADRRYGLPGSYRLEFTPVWMIADELLLRRSHARALSILQASPWDAGIISEGIDPDTARVDQSGRAFATAAGYVAHALCASACLPRP